MKRRELVEAWVEAFNKRDIAALTDFYSDTATNFQVPELPVIGREAIGAMFRDAFAVAGMVCIPENIFEDGEWAILDGAIRSACAVAVSSILSIVKSCSSVGTGTN